MAIQPTSAEKETLRIVIPGDCMLGRGVDMVAIGTQEGDCLKSAPSCRNESS